MIKRLVFVFFGLLFISIALFSSRALAKEATPKLSFGLMADAQYANQDNRENRFYVESLKKVSEAVDDFNGENLSFVIHLGDLIDNRLESYDSILPVLKKLESKLYHALGNHDYEVEANQKQRVPELLEMSERYYSYSVSDWNFIVLDGNELSFYATTEMDGHKSQRDEMYERLKPEKENIHRWNGGIGKEQIQWLSNQLKETCESGKQAMVFSHFPVYPPGPYNLWNDDEIVAVLERHNCVKAYMNGHNHEGNYAVKQGIHYLTVPAIVNTEENAYAVVDIYQDNIDVRGRGRLKNQNLSLVAPKNTPVQSRDQNEYLNSSQQTAYDKFLKSKRSELSKLIFLIDKHRQEEFYVVHDGVEYESNWALMQARRYLAENYDKENAMDWIKKHAYRSIYGGHIIYWKSLDDTVLPLRDVLLEDLEELNLKLKSE